MVELWRRELETVSLLTALQNTLETITQTLLAPTIIILIALMVYAVFCIGSIIVERATERSHYNVNMPDFLQGLERTPIDAVGVYIDQSNLLKMQKDALRTVFDNRNLPEEARFALAKKMVTEVTTHYQ